MSTGTLGKAVAVWRAVELYKYTLPLNGCSGSVVHVGVADAVHTSPINRRGERVRKVLRRGSKTPVGGFYLLLTYALQNSKALCRVAIIIRLFSGFT